MPTSYAQNLEDIMIWRALKHVEKGTYVDVGANHPVWDSVTNLFYQSGWSGINIEPIERWFRELQLHRPRDINLMLAISSSLGPITLYDFPDTGLTTSDPDNKRRAELLTGRVSSEVQVPSRTLDQVLLEHRLPDIHFLKVDVEGAEADVLRSLSFDSTRPWIVVVESMLPNLQQSTHEAWEHLLIASDYFLVFSDGLNRFYVASEHSELATAFEYPPNVFDGYKTYIQVRCEEERAEIQALKDSVSWKLTSRLYSAEKIFRRKFRR